MSKAIAASPPIKRKRGRPKKITPADFVHPDGDQIVAEKDIELDPPWLKPQAKKRGRPRKIDPLAPTQADANRWHEKGMREGITAPSKPKNGRPLLITPQMFSLVEEYASNGWGHNQIAEALDVCNDTYRQYRNKDRLSEEDKLALSLADKRGRTKWRLFLAEENRKKISSPSGAVSLIVAMRQPQGHDYKDQQTVEHTGGITITVQRKLIGDDGVIDVTPQLEDEG